MNKISDRSLYAFTLLITLGLLASFSIVGFAAPAPPEGSSITAEDRTVQAKGTFTAKATLYDSDGNPLGSGYEVKFYLNYTADDPDATATTDSNGVATVEMDGPQDPAGDSYDNYEYVAYISTETGYTNDTANLTVEPIPTVLEVRTTNQSKRDRPGYRPEGRYSLGKIGRFYESWRKRESCVFIHTPGFVRGWF